MAGTRNRAVLFLAAAAIFVTGCGTPEIDSVWKNREITIDGSDPGTEWEGARHYFEDQKVTLGVMNDADFLYLRLSSRDRTVQGKILMLGLTVWVNPEGNKEKYLGVHFPVGRSGRPGMQSGMAGRSQEGRPSAGPMQGDMQEMLQGALGSIELIGPGSDETNPLAAVEADSLGILARIGIEGGNMVYELRLPLKPFERSLYYISKETLEKIGLGFQTGKMEFRRRTREGGPRGGGGGMGGGGDIGGMGGMGGRGGGIGGMGGTGGRGGGMTSPNMNPLELWMRIAIQSSPRT